MTFRLCKEDEESQPHLFSCIEILSDKSVKDAIEGYTYNDTFSDNPKTQEQMIFIWHKQSSWIRIIFFTSDNDLCNYRGTKKDINKHLIISH